MKALHIAPAACALRVRARRVRLRVGGDDDAIRQAGPNPNDKRTVALACITREKDVPARLVGEKSIQVDGSNAPARRVLRLIRRGRGAPVPG